MSLADLYSRDACVVFVELRPPTGIAFKQLVALAASRIAVVMSDNPGAVSAAEPVRDLGSSGGGVCSCRSTLRAGLLDEPS